ncbi:hypothetical protein COCCADRAFT_107826 [Bipolaris zeicola 26-R-13]|uniref:Uncharacterized protein n=1 Tax=Cochliobolus carbonum (strain 26-R-13) TaxID=930089 RepID=W6XUQ5_COCC2|nr:uncharacterized protein COCCADRAFT_107826 [Bipolaris zeicola 26-R-13]EUC28935.1 hypothetical protein COCCADRAFT_107826 [Bipolaris zeicola 26-R-13]
MVSVTEVSGPPSYSGPATRNARLNQSLSIRHPQFGYSPSIFSDIFPLTALPVGSFVQPSFGFNTDSRHLSGPHTRNMSSQSQPSSNFDEYSLRNVRAVRQNHLSMPDHSEFVAAAISRQNTTQLSSAMQSKTKPPPYPLHDETVHTQSTNIVHNSYDIYLRQPTAEDFLRQQHPLPPPPVEVCDIGQDLPVIQPDSYLEMDQLEQPIEGPSNSQPGEIDTDTPTHPSTKSSPEPSFSYHTSRVQSIDSDMYQPGLGGLHKISNIQRKTSKCSKVKNAVSRLYPFRSQRRFGSTTKR